MSTPGIPVTIRGVTYPSGVMAARAHGVTVSCIYHARRKGTLDRVGLLPMKGHAIFALLARATPDDLPNLKRQAQLWLALSEKRSRK